MNERFEINAEAVLFGNERNAENRGCDHCGCGKKD